MTDIVITNWFHQPINIKSKRLQEAAISQFCELPSRKAVKKAIKKGRIFINGKRGETHNWVKIGDRLSLEESVVVNSEIYNNNLLKTSVIWEDEYGACVIKNAGIETNGISKVTLEKVYSNILKYSILPDSISAPRTVHRLDKATHGLVLIAKTLSMASELGKSFEKREISKSYTALIEGSPRLSFFEINIPINGKFASSNIEIENDLLIIKHMYIENKMTPLNMYLETANIKQQNHIINDYGKAIDELINSNIFPGDMLTKNFGVTRQNRVVFYDYDEITLMSTPIFKKIPKAKTYEQEMASEPWYYVGQNDVFPEEFKYFMLPNPYMKEVFNKKYKKLLDADYWVSIQEKIKQNGVMDYYPYGSEKRMCEIYKDN